MSRTAGYVTRIVARLMRETPDVVQRDIARALGVDRSRISQQLTGRYALPADDLEVYCDYLDTVEPLEAIADRLGYRLVPHERHAPARTVQRASWQLMREVGEFGEALGLALDDGDLSDDERQTLRRALADVRRVTDAMVARLGTTHASRKFPLT